MTGATDRRAARGTIGLALAMGQLFRGHLFPPAVTAAWYAARLAGLFAEGDHREDAE